MQLSSTIEYALRAVVWLAQNHGSAQTSQQIADGTRMPSSYLSKVLKGLTREGIVNSQRGPNGGYTLAKDPDRLTLLEVVNAVEPVQRIRECPLKIGGHGKNLCGLHRTLDDTMKAVETAFRQQTIGDLLRRPTKSKPLCDPNAKTKGMSLTVGGNKT